MVLNLNLNYNRQNIMNYRLIEKEYPVSGSLPEIGINNMFKIFIESEDFKGNQIGIVTKVKTLEGNIFTIGNKAAINPKSPKDILEYVNYIDNKSLWMESWYTNAILVSVSFVYSEISTEDYKRVQSKFRISTNKKVSVLSNNLAYGLPHNIPLNSNYTEWGDDVNINNNIIDIRSITFNPRLRNSVCIYIKKISTNENLITFNKISDNSVLFNFIDTLTSNQIIRQYENKKFIIENETIVLYLNLSKNSNMNYIKKTAKSARNFFNSKLMTLDIETYLNNKNEMHLYCLSIYNGKFKFSYYLNDFKTITNLLNKVFKDLFNKYNSGKIIYIHNSSEFDLIFLLKHLVQMPNVELNPIIKDGKFINLEIRYTIKDSDKTQYTLTLRDSMLILPSSLSKLAKGFDLKMGKGFFPYSFVNENNLDYKGSIPEYKYFDSDKITLSEYENYKSKFSNKLWILRKEAISYCEQDCVLLYNILNKFGNEIYKEFKVNIYLTPTLPSLAFRIFRTHYMKNNSIPILTDNYYNDLVNAYYGGHCDVYIPKNDKNLVYCYDVNGLYPYAMKMFQFPTKLLTYFFGDITKDNNYNTMLNNEKAVGMFQVRVNAPDTLKNPILPRKYNGVTVYGTGTWTGWYFSEELKIAKSLGYKFEILSGYVFKSEPLFADYVNTLNKMKENSNKNSIKYIIAKLLLNSLYGRFAMSPLLLNHIILEENSKDYNEFIDTIKFENVETEVKLGNKVLISYTDSNNTNTSNLNINMAIGLATSSYARIHMSQFKNNSNFNVYYTDTDSIFTDQPLPNHLVDDKKLGYMKLEYTLTDFVAIAPKVYGGIKTNGDEFTKVKGFKNSVSFDQLKSLLNNSEGKITLMHQKWINNISDSLIKIKDSEYNLKPNNNKRELVYENNSLIATKNKVFTD